MKFLDFPREQLRKRNVLDQFIFSTRVRLARNLEGLKFPVLLSEKEKKAIENEMIKYLKKIPFEMDIATIDELPRELIFTYLSNHVITQEFFKNGNLMAYDVNGNWVIMINEDDHIRIHSIEEGYNAKNIYNRISSIMILLEEEVDFSFDEKYGYLTSSILNMGTGLRVSVIANLYGLVALKKIEPFIDSANKIGYSVVNLTSKNSDSSLFYIYNIFSLGISEEDLLNEFETFLIRLYNIEKEAREAFFTKREEVDISLEEIFELKTMNNISWSNLVYYVSLIDALNKKYLTADNIKQIRKLVFTTQDEYLIYESQVERSKIEKVRLDILNKSISGIKYKKAKFL